MNKLKPSIIAALSLLFLIPSFSFAEIQSIPALTLTQNGAGVQQYSLSLQILLGMTFLTLLPAALMMMTSFTRVIIVFSILRQAVGMPQIPTNQILVGMALFLSFFIMAPVFDKVNQQALTPYLAEKINAQQALNLAQQPIREFMIKQIRKDDLYLFAKLAGIKNVTDPKLMPFTVLMPSFVTSELKTAFQMGFLMFLPFLIIDLVVASVLMALGMMMLSPMIISLPFKIMLFVLVDGWGLVMATLAGSFGL